MRASQGHDSNIASKEGSLQFICEVGTRITRGFRLSL